MTVFTSNNWLLIVLSTGLLVTACASYYKVTDPSTGSVYYTQGVERERGGAAKFKDARTDSEVTIQNSEVKEISKAEFDAGRFAAETKPAPVPTQAAPPAAPVAPATTPDTPPASEQAPTPAESPAPTESTTPAETAPPEEAK